MLLYLDFDGVLHSEFVEFVPDEPPRLPVRHGRLFEHCAALEAAIAPFPELRIVLSTSWVRHCGFAYAARQLPPALRARVIGATFHTSMLRNDPFNDPHYCATGMKCAFDLLTRYQAVAGDAGRRGSTKWIAVDDDHQGWPHEELERLVWTNGSAGLGEPARCQELTDRLRRMRSRAP